jgi:hypothetical protein
MSAMTNLDPTPYQEDRFYYQALDEYNHADLVESTGELYGIVDDEAGGIIAYALGSENAIKIVRALARLSEDER